MRSSWIGLTALLAVACDYTPREERRVSADELQQLCSQCHGANLEGNRDVNAPAIAGLPAWYIESQLQKFKQGHRGTHALDYAGMQMRPMAISFHNDAEIKTISTRVAELAVARPAPTLDGDATAGQALFGTCTACHGPKGAGNEQLKAPPIAQLNDWYLLTQLQHFKDGVRGADPRDSTGAQMAPMAKILADEAAMKNVIAHIMTLR